MKNLEKVLMALALGAVILMPGVATAYPTVDLYEVGVNNSAIANIYVPGPDFGYNLSVYAGNYILSISNPSGSGNPYTQYGGYCVEPALSSSTPRVYELLPIAKGSAFAAAAWILSQGYITLAPAAQAAVWELTWDTALGKPYILSADNFRLNSGINSTDVGMINNDAIAAIKAGFDPSCYVIAHNPVGPGGWAYSQDYIIPNTVPVPPTLLLLSSGLIGLGLLRRKRSLEKKAFNTPDIPKEESAMVLPFL